MDEQMKILRRCQLFQGVTEDGISEMLTCLEARWRTAKKNQSIFCEGDPAVYVGIVLSGKVQVVQDDYYGVRSIFSVLQPAQLFGESFACAGVETLPVSVIAVEDSQVILLDGRRITGMCANGCKYHSQVIQNLLRVMANKNLVFRQKIEITSKRTTREKLMTFLLSQAKSHGSNSFTIAYDRQELADYLGVERSAMSAEISKLRRQGVLESERSFFRLL